MQSDLDVWMDGEIKLHVLEIHKLVDQLLENSKKMFALVYRLREEGFEASFGVVTIPKDRSGRPEPTFKEQQDLCTIAAMERYLNSQIPAKRRDALAKRGLNVGIFALKMTYEKPKQNLLSGETRSHSQQHCESD